MANTEYRTGSIKSGDVELAFHAYGKAGGETPLLIMHGTNYYDSTDWLEVAGTLASDREVVTFDHRGFGQSRLERVQRLFGRCVYGRRPECHRAFRLEKNQLSLVILCQGRLVTFFAANFPDHLSRLIIADSGFDHGAPGYL